MEIKPIQPLKEQGIFKALLDAAPDATVIVDRNGRVQMVNKQTENLFGYVREELIGQPVEIFIPQALWLAHKQHRKNFGKEPRVRSMGAGLELEAVKKDGTKFPVEISLSPLQTEEGLLISASIRDITQRKKSEQKFKALLDAAPDATVIVNEDGLIEMINHQTENLFGYSRDEMIGRPVEILIPGELSSKHVHHREGFAKEARVRTMGEGISLNAVKKNGSRFPVEISLSPIQTEEGMLVSASVRDITLRKNLENDLKRTNEELEAFTYSVSHDLRAPLRGIIGFTAILEEEYSNKFDDEARRITSVIKNNTLKMGHLIDDLLTFSHMGRQDIVKTSVDTRIMIDEVIKELIPNNVGLYIDWHIHPLPGINADISTIRQVWVNFISNSIKYSGNKKHPRIEIGSFHHEGQIAFFIKDNGVGFDEKHKDKLFKVFQRLHSAEEFEGTGIGLALVEKIVSKHGGKVWATGEVDQGASFYFSLPSE
jgi:PAS domain S-box-containing protein